MVKWHLEGLLFSCNGTCIINRCPRRNVSSCWVTTKLHLCIFPSWFLHCKSLLEFSKNAIVCITCHKIFFRNHFFEGQYFRIWKGYIQSFVIRDIGTWRYVEQARLHEKVRKNCIFGHFSSFCSQNGRKCYFYKFYDVIWRVQHIFMCQYLGLQNFEYILFGSWNTGLQKSDFEKISYDTWSKKLHFSKIPVRIYSVKSKREICRNGVFSWLNSFKRFV